MSKILDSITSDPNFKFLFPVSSYPPFYEEQDLKKTNKDSSFDVIRKIMAKAKKNFNLYYEHYVYSKYERNFSSSSYHKDRIDTLLDCYGYVSASFSETKQTIEYPFVNSQDHIEHFKNFFAVPFDSVNKISSVQSDSTKDNISFLFPGVKYINSDTVIFEQPPSYRYVSYQEAYRDALSNETPYNEFYVPLPWQIYVAKFSPDMRLVAVNMYLSNTPFYSFDQPLYSCPMFNFYSNGNLCRPFFSAMEDIEKYSKDISGVIASAFDWIWNSGFNYDITMSISDYLCSKNFISMQAYIPDDYKIKSYMTTLISYYNRYGNNVCVIPQNSVNPEHIRMLFAIWESININDILNIKWNSFCKYSDFFYQSTEYYIDTTPEIMEYFNNYVSSNNITIGDPEEYEEEDSYSENHYASLDDVISSSQFYSKVLNKMYSTSSTMRDAVRMINRSYSFGSSSAKDSYSFQLEVFSNLVNSYLSPK